MTRLRHYILNDDHSVRAIDDLLTWAREFEHAKRIVAKTDVGCASVSTVFLGLDHRIDFRNTEHGPPILFETMVFGGPLDGEQERYETWDEAIAGHDRMVAFAREGRRAR